MAKSESPTIGDNSFSAETLAEMIGRIENLIDDRAAVNADIKGVMEEAELLGYDKKTIKDVIRLRAMDPGERADRESLRDMYLNAMGLV